MISQTIARYSAGFCKIDMTEGNRGWCRKGRRLRIEALLEMQLHNNRPPHLSHHWPSQSVKRPKKRRDCRWISHRLLCRSCRIFGRSFWCSWNSPRSMLPPSPEGCAIACKLKRGSKNGSQQIVTKKIVPIFFTWVREVGGGVNADDGCDEWDCSEKDEQESESNPSESHLPPPTFILYQTKVLPIMFAGCANIFWIFLTYLLAFDLAARSMYSVHLIQNTTLVPCRLAQLSGSLHKLIWSKILFSKCVC